MTTCYRIVKREGERFAFTGEGPAEHPGRWNHRGYRVVYTAESRALASLEIMVNMVKESTKRLRFSLFTVTIPRGLEITTLGVKDLPARWRRVPPSDLTRDIGSKWLKAAHSAVLAVPSAIIPEERNYLLNPLHPDFPKIAVSAPQPFSFDSRILKGLAG